jgi:hypothetical protein
MLSSPGSSDMSSAESSSGACWFCGRGEGREHSVALPFWSNVSDDVQVLVLPRCDRCHAFHDRQKYPSGLIVVAFAAVPMLLLAPWPIPESLRGVLMVVAMASGFVGGIVFTANREARQAHAHGTRPLPDYVQHPPYLTLAADTRTWRQTRTPGIGDGSGSRRETVADYRRYFTGIANDPVALAALERGCIAAGVSFDRQ